ncbi:MAG: UDP-N-acetylmuramate--L-alanine ligase [Deltaproteobacteria bacterium]|nr:MAG: UDP-N-acetylmuramate--L-alanine ligase [Deltaproteobacteria bacterium]
MYPWQKKVKLHFIGIGGIGMSGIAECLISLGHIVSGSDLNPSANTERLKKLGAEIFIGHKKENIAGATLIVYSSAINSSNPEMAHALKLNLPIMKRAEMLAELMRLKIGLAVAGTHGKTTTTSFLATILQEAGLDPTYIIGGIVENLKGNAKVGQGDFLVAEADESDGSFLLLSPIMSVITNIDNDHLDFYGSKEKLFDCFVEFANKIPFYGICALYINDPMIKKLKGRMKKPYLTFGLKEEGEKTPDFWAENIISHKFKTQYDLYYKGEFATKITINIPGEHNVINSLGAIALAHNLNIDIQVIARSIAKFKGVGRRFELLYTGPGVEIIDDYAHHPTAISSTIKTVIETRGQDKLKVIFEPHRFSRTQDLWDKFIHCFEGVHEIVLCPVYPAGEGPIKGINSTNLASEINKSYPGLVTSLTGLDDLNDHLIPESSERVTILVLGAGSIGKKARQIVGGF